ncbi:MAG: transposase, partial [Intrasporangiaceae bacterium]|nr:transposase [Intrasporangiaceae bacterium]
MVAGPGPGWRSWPDQELDRLALAAPGVSHHSPAETSVPDRNHVPVRRRRERMNSLTDLREVVDVVIGVDTHVHTHSAAVVDAATGGVLDEITVAATAEGYGELVEFANNHPMLRAWAIEGTGGHGAGLSRHLLQACEIVIELDRPKRAARRNGAKSDPLDAIRAAREAMARPRLGTPRSGGERQALSVLLAARRSAINASTEAQLQVFSLVIAAPEPIRARFRGQKLAAMLTTAANLRVHASWDIETTSTVVALRALARRAHAMLKEARAHEKALVAIIRSWRPDLLEEFGVGPIVAATVLCAWSHPGRIHSEAAFAMLAGVAPIPGEQRPSHHPVSAQPLRRPPAQPSAAHRGAEPDPVPASHPR